MMWFCLIVYAGCMLVLAYMASHTVKNTVQKLSPNAWWGLNLSDGTWVNILIPREKDPESYVGTWMRMHGGKRVVRAVNREDGSELVFE